MFNLKNFKPTTFLISFTIATGTIIPLFSLTPAQAQLFPSRESSDRDRSPQDSDRTYRNNRYGSFVIPRGQTIPVAYEKDKILVTKEETVPITLTVAANIRDRRGTTWIPYGTEIEGKIEPVGEDEGSRFVAEKLVFADGNTQFIDATSQTVTRTETIKKGANAGDILKGAAIGGAAATVLSDIFGDIKLGKVLGGAGIGAVAGLLLGGSKAELISIDPNSDLNLTLESDLALR
jgi:hypothetical protein